MMRRIAVPAAMLLVGASFAASCGLDRTSPVVFPELVIATDSLATATRGVPYNHSVHAEGGDSAYAWVLTAGEPPPGIALTVDDLGEVDHAILSGVPEVDGLFTFTITVTSGDGQQASHTFELEVRPEIPLAIETPAVPPALTGWVYDVRLRAYGGDGQTFQWSVVAGSLPNDMTLTPEGRIQGTPATPDTVRFTAEVRSGAQAVRREFRLVVEPHRPDEYNITLFPVVPVPAGVAPHLQAAVADWEAAITEGLPALRIPPGFFQPDHCGGFGELINGAPSDDILIIVNIAPIDGPGGVLGQAGPCGLRGSDLPFAGIITLDSDDLELLVGNETLTHIISHEIAHVLGFGTLWRRLDLLTGAGEDDPQFTGESAVTAYQALGGEGTVPVERQGGQGTRDSHWRQTVFGNERLTGFSAPPGVFQPLSRVSLASFIDLGYVVDLDQADHFSLGAALRAHGEHLGYDEVLREPIRILHPDGRTETYTPR